MVRAGTPDAFDRRPFEVSTSQGSTITLSLPPGKPLPRRRKTGKRVE